MSTNRFIFFFFFQIIILLLHMLLAFCFLQRVINGFDCVVFGLYSCGPSVVAAHSAGDTGDMLVWFDLVWFGFMAYQPL